MMGNGVLPHGDRNKHEETGIMVFFLQRQYGMLPQEKNPVALIQSIIA
jgi:hypothetical protein